MTQFEGSPGVPGPPGTGVPTRESADSAPTPQAAEIEAARQPAEAGPAPQAAESTAAADSATAPGTPATSAASGAPAASAPPTGSPVAGAMAELELLARRELAEHPDTYQRIHAELQAALATIDNA